MTNHETGSDGLIGRLSAAERKGRRGKPGGFAAAEAPVTRERAARERRSYDSASEQPDGALRGDGMRIRKDVEDLHLTGDPLVVAPLEAACRHLGGHPVAEVMGTAEAQGRRAAEACGIEGSEQQRRTLEVIGRVESHLRVDVAPIRGGRAETQLPLGAQLFLRAQLLWKGLLNALQLQGSGDAPVAAARQQTA